MRLSVNQVDELVRAHQAHIYRYLRFLGAAEDLVEDLVQDTFVAASSNRNPPPIESVPRRLGWLRAIARNTFLNHCRKQKRNPVRADSELMTRAESYWNSAFAQHDDGYGYMEALIACTKKLSARHRDVLEHRYALRKSRGEMAAFFKVTDDGIKIMLRRIRAVLAKCVQQTLAIENGS